MWLKASMTTSMLRCRAQSDDISSRISRWAFSQNRTFQSANLHGKEKKKREDFARDRIYFPEEGTLSSRELGAWNLTRILTLFPYVRKQDGLLPDRDYRDARWEWSQEETPKNKTMLTEFRKSLAVSVCTPLYTPNLESSSIARYAR